MQSSPLRARRLGVKKLQESGKWISLNAISWQDEKGRSRMWETVERTTRSQSTGVDAVAIFPRIFGTNGPDRTVLVKQYRPPLDAYTLENPAGLIDANETIEEAALRELHEETGYVGKVTRISRSIFNDPGLSNANFAYAFVDCDLSDPRNQNPVAKPDENENIELVVLPVANLLQSMEELAEKEGLEIDAKCYSLALGMSMSSKM